VRVAIEELSRARPQRKTSALANPKIPEALLNQ
jgi:hypothetical protein